MQCDERSIIQVINSKANHFFLTYNLRRLAIIRQIVPLFQREHQKMTFFKSRQLSSPNLIMSCLTLSYLICMAYCQQSEHLLPQKLINSNFMEPAIAYSEHIANGIPGWKCTQECQIDNCFTRAIQRVYVVRSPFVECEGQVVDINSASLVASIEQTVYLKAAQHRLSFHYYLPYQDAHKKFMKVFFNGNVVFFSHPQTSAIFTRFTHSMLVDGLEGTNNLTFHNYGKVSDGHGFRINTVSIRQVYSPDFENLLNDSLSNAFSTSIIAIPGIRGILGELLNMFVSLDRFQLYLYHNRTYAYHALLLLENVNELLALKGSLAHVTLSTLAPAFLAQCESFASSLAFKNKYASLLITREPQTGFGFVSNNETLILYSAPFCLVIFLIFNLSFQALFHSPLSKLFRKFCFGGILLWMVSEGNVEVFTFYVFGEFLTFFSASPLHKAVYAFLAVFYYSVIFTAVAAIWWFRFHYKAQLRYFLQDSKLCALSMWSVLMDHGIVSLVSGALHQILKNSPNLQLYSLGVVQLIWIGLRIFFAAKGVYRRRLYMSFCLFDSLLRIAFQVQAFFYSNNPQLRIQINSEVMTTLIYIFLGLWYCQCFLAVIYGAKDIYQILRDRTNISASNKVYPIMETENNHEILSRNQIEREVKESVKEKQKTRDLVDYSSYYRFIHEKVVSIARKKDKETERSLNKTRNKPTVKHKILRSKTNNTKTGHVIPF